MDGTASYDGLLIAMQKRLSDNYSVTTNYTLSECINDADPQQFLDPCTRIPATLRPIAGRARAIAGTC